MCNQQLCRLRWGCLLLLVVGAALLWTGQAQAAPPVPGSPNVYWVNDPGDAADANPGDGICDVTLGVTPLPGTGREPCTLRAAIEEANLDWAAGIPSVIAFEICLNDGPVWSGSGGQMLPTGEVIIQPGMVGGPLPAMTDNLTYINGYTQGYPSFTPGYDDPAVVPGSCTAPLIAMPNTASFGLPMNTVLAVEVEGSLCVPPVPLAGSTMTAVPGGFVPSGSILPWNGVAGACSGFTVLSDKNVIAGLNIRTWANAGILIMPSPLELNPPTQNVIWGNFIGTGITGEDANSIERFGVEIVGGVSETFIGETYYLSTTTFFPLQEYGWVEEPTSDERNLISGNTNVARVYGNNCALDNASVLSFYDDGAGVFIGYDPCIRANAGNSPHESDLLLGGGVWNEVRNNYIGTDKGGAFPLPNTNGVWLNYEAAWNHVGGCVKFPFVSGPHPECFPHHTLDFEQDANLISGNTRITGVGVYVGGHGVWLNGTPFPHLSEDPGGVTLNEVGGNFIGTDATGMEGVPNSGNGVYLRAGIDLGAPKNNEVGATAEFVDLDNAYQYGNLISSNGDINNEMFDDILPPGYPFGPFNNGVELLGLGVVSNRIGYGNVIGLDSQLVGPLGNGDNGVLIWFMPSENYVHNNAGVNISQPFVSGDPPSDAGAIGANGAFATALGRSGVKIEDASFNAVFRNCIGGDGGACDVPLGNASHGVLITRTATLNTIGLNPTGGLTNTAIAAGNWIHHNGVSGAGDGVAVVDDGSTENTIRFNAIWLNGNPVDGNLGIDLGDDNDTPNGSGPVGPNNFQDYPNNLSGTTAWLVNFSACSNCTVDLYATLVSESDYPPGNPTNNGEGRHWLQSIAGTGVIQQVDVSARINAIFGVLPSENVCISLTATDPNGNTSEFSPCVRFDPNRVALSGLTPRGWLALVPATLGVLAVALLLRRRRTSAG